MNGLFELSADTTIVMVIAITLAALLERFFLQRRSVPSRSCPEKTAKVVGPQHRPNPVPAHTRPSTVKATPSQLSEQCRHVNAKTSFSIRDWLEILARTFAFKRIGERQRSHVRIQQPQRLSKNSQWTALTSIVAESVDAVASVDRWQIAAEQQVDAAVYAINGLLDELTSVMPHHELCRVTNMTETAQQQLTSRKADNLPPIGYAVAV